MGKIKRRAPVACKRCRKLKVKCTGNQPCARCDKFNLKCTFVSSEDIDKNAFKDDNSKTKYQRFSKEEEDQGTNVPFFSNDSKDEEISKLKKRFNDLKRFDFAVYDQWRIQGSCQNKLLRLLCESNLKQIPSNISSPIRIPRTQYYGWNMSGIQYLQQNKFPERPGYDFSKRHDELLHYFFKEINPLFGTLQEDFLRYFSSRYLDFMKMLGECSFKSNNNTTLYASILYLVYAISIRFTEFSKEEGPDFSMVSLGCECFNFSYNVVKILSFEFSSLELIQGWLLICLYLRISHSQRSLLSSLDQANCMARNMGLHLKNMVANLDLVINKKARQTFWCLYTFDQIFSLQVGRFSFWNLKEISTEAPNDYFNSEDEMCSDISSFAMYKLALLAHEVQSTKNKDLDEFEVFQIRMRVEKMRKWLHERGYFEDMLSEKIAKQNLPSNGEQVILHYCEISFCLHGPHLFNYVGEKHSNGALRCESLLSAMKTVIETFNHMRSHSLLKTPWYNVLSLLFCVGSFGLAMINGGILVRDARDLYFSAIELLTEISSFEIMLGNNKRTQFPMAKECLWALSQASKCIRLRFAEELKQLIEIEPGIDADINKNNFGSIGNYNDENHISTLTDHSSGQNKKLVDQSTHHAFGNDVSGHSPYFLGDNTFYPPEISSSENNLIFENPWLSDLESENLIDDFLLFMENH